MAQSYTDASGYTLIIPSSAVTTTVVTNPTGIATTGVLALIGESDEGPSWDDSNEGKLSDNSYGPQDIQRVTSKYKSGRLVDAFRGAVAASSSPRIQGSFNRVILVKTNASSAASHNTADGHGTISANRQGASGNLIKSTITTSTAELAPTTSQISYVPSASASVLKARVNGGSEQSLSISANTTPAALATAITGLNNLNASGGVNRSALSGLTGINIALAVVSGQNVNISLAAGSVFTTSPQVGDTLRIPAGSVIEGVGAANVGWYLVTAVSNTATSAQISAKKITSGAPLAVSATAISATPDNDMIDYSSMKIDNMSGTDRSVLTGLVGQNITATAVSSTLTLTLASGQVWASSPQVGDLMRIPASSVMAGAGNANVGWYQVTASSNTTSNASLSASRLSNGSPVAVATASIGATSDVQVLDKQIKGAGKSLEINDGAGATNLGNLLKGLGVDSAASFIGTILTSSAELIKNFSLIRSSTSSQESFNIGGNISMLVGYNGTTASLSISGNTLSTSVTGGLGANLSINLASYSLLSDLVAYINSQTGYSASLASVAEGQKNPSVLDRVSSIGICSAIGTPGRIKRDINDLTKANTSLNALSSLVKYTAILSAGLPSDEASVFLSGGAKGGTSGLRFSQAIDALQAVRANFIIPLVSQDASDDITAAETDASSTYLVDSVNAAVKSHCITMSTAKVKRHRVGIVSKNGYSAAKTSAQTMASFRIAHTFQSVKDTGSDGDIKTFQSWMGAVKAGSMQAAGFYKSIFNKSVNVSGVVDPSGFDNENNSQVEDALLNGLIPLQRQDTGGFTFVSDQMTYNTDNNFVYNSLQAVYVADVMALSLAQSLQNAFVGESVSDVTVGTVISFVKGKLAEFLSLKLIAPSQGAPAGWKNIDVQLNAPVLNVNVTVCEATSIYFIPINLTIENVKASASA